ncbi:isochorismatase family protein [Solicola gregarius]|uniref:Isochorismatase family protein n=1 Tax=Solicola gregarius TaxID=2908642 RepID=A0AA46YL99_9ACTN|nr:isochorismatase family protein [Solicola gregarius]UYM04663.1 isochorismatase family protein [Solicola gregarius]
MADHASGFAGTLTPGERPAVLAIDLMAAYFTPGSAFCLPSRDCLESAARVVEVARVAGVPVIHTRVEFAPDAVDGGVFVQKVPALKALAGGGELGRFMPEVAPRTGELVLVKQYASAFFGTTLASTLNAMRVDTVVIVGVSTSGCVRASAVDAIQHGYVPLVVRDAVGDRGPEPHEANLYDLQAKYAEVIAEPAARCYLKGGGTGADPGSRPSRWASE